VKAPAAPFLPLKSFDRGLALELHVPVRPVDQVDHVLRVVGVVVKVQFWLRDLEPVLALVAVRVELPGIVLAGVVRAPHKPAVSGRGQRDVDLKGVVRAGVEPHPFQGGGARPDTLERVAGQRSRNPRRGSQGPVEVHAPLLCTRADVLDLGLAGRQIGRQRRRVCFEDLVCERNARENQCEKRNGGCERGARSEHCRVLRASPQGSQGEAASGAVRAMRPALGSVLSLRLRLDRGKFKNSGVTGVELAQISDGQGLAFEGVDLGGRNPRIPGEARAVLRSWFFGPLRPTAFPSAPVPQSGYALPEQSRSPVAFWNPVVDLISAPRFPCGATLSLIFGGFPMPRLARSPWFAVTCLALLIAAPLIYASCARTNTAIASTALGSLVGCGHWPEHPQCRSLTGHWLLRPSLAWVAAQLVLDRAPPGVRGVAAWMGGAWRHDEAGGVPKVVQVPC
jgi:hypothetical protein